MFSTLLAVSQVQAAGRSNLFNEAVRQIADPELSFVMIVVLGLIGAVVGFVIVPYMWERSASTRSLWQSLCRIERENHRLREQIETASDKTEIVMQPESPKSLFHLQDKESFEHTGYLEGVIRSIRTSLNGILGCSRLLQDGTLSLDKSEIVDSIRSNVDGVIELTDELLGFAGIEKRPPDELVVFDLEEMVHAVRKSLGSDAWVHAVRIQVEFMKEMPRRLHGNRRDLQRALSRIVGSAVRQSNGRAVHLRVEAVENSEKSVRLRFTINRTEPEHDHTDLNHSLLGSVPESENSADSGRIWNPDLLIAEKYLESLEGKLELSSDDNVSFMVSMQLAPVSSEPEPPSAAEKSIRLLIVEDDRTNRHVLQKLLIRSGYNVDVAEDGAQALKMLEQEEFDLILMDLELPVMDGYQSTQKIRSGDVCPQIPILALTANADRDDAERCLALGMNDYLTKPCEIDTLLAALQHWLPNSQIR